MAVKKQTIKSKKTNKKQKYIIRSYAAGVFAGEITEQKATPAGLIIKASNVRRIHYWEGAASCSQLATTGPLKQSECRISVETDNHIIVNVVEYIPMTAEAEKNIYSIAEWKIKND